MPAEVRTTLEKCDTAAPPPAETCEEATWDFYRRFVIRSSRADGIAEYRAGAPRNAGDTLYQRMWGKAEFVSTGTLRDYDGEPLLAKLIGAKRCIEVGVFTGYSSLAVALALPEDGRILACDVSEQWTAIARKFWREAGVEHKIELKLQPAVRTLEQLLAAGEAGRYDFAFVDADKPAYDTYYELLLKLLRPGGLMALDNTLWSGAVANPNEREPNTVALRTLNDKLHRDERIDLSLLPVGDGLTIARKR
jgi:caffeoyl-CoA O-methyltransferase